MKQRMLLIRNLVGLLLLPLVGVCAERNKPIPHPTDYELERIVGNRPESAVRVTSWRAPEPQQTNACIYSVLLPQMDEALLRRVAEKFGVNGEVEQISGDTLGHIGYWIKETNTADLRRNQEVKFWLTMGSFSYGTGDDG